MNRPLLSLFCPGCEDTRNFECTNTAPTNLYQAPSDKFLIFRCRDCQRHFRTYALSAAWRDDSSVGIVFKYGERPPFIPVVPARLMRLLGTDWELFRKGLRSEAMGFGVGAFSYYRKAVERQKNRLIMQVRKVAERVHADPEMLAALDGALEERSFTKAMESLEGAVPEVLLVFEHNPLTLLHDVLSEPLHEVNIAGEAGDTSDEDALELAASVRTILVELVNRMAEVTKDETTVKEALTKILSRKEEGGP